MGRLAENAASALIPAPVGGLNTRDPLYAMPNTDAIQFDNVVAEAAYCRKIGGLESYYDFGASSFCGTLMSFSLVTGEEKLVSVWTEGGVYHVYDNSAASPVDIGPGSLLWNSDQWQYTTYRNRLFFVNGLDAPQDWTGSGNINATAWTGSGLTITNLINVATYRSRLYFVEKNTCNIWYGAVDTVSGALTKFDVQSLLAKGGKVVYAGSSSGITGVNNDELFVIFSDQGEVLVYQGTNPADSTWNLIGHYFIARPITIQNAYRCAFHVGGDLNLLTYDGPVPVGDLLRGVPQDNDFTAFSGKVRQAFVEASQDANTLITPVPQEPAFAVYYPSNHYMVISIPKAQTSGVTPTYFTAVFLYNFISKAWSKLPSFNIQAMAVYQNQLYTAHKNANGHAILYKFDRTYSNGESDAAISWEIRQAYNFLETSKNNKIITTIQPYVSLQKASGGAGTTSFDVGVDIDFEQDSGGTPPTWSFNHDSSAAKFNKEVLDASGEGRCFSLHMKGSNSAVDLKFFCNWASFNLGGEVQD